MSWRRGVRNWLDLGGALVVTSLGEAFYDRAMLTVDAAPMAGPLKRMSRVSQLRGVATLRVGVAWVPTLQLAIGPGAAPACMGRRSMFSTASTRGSRWTS